MLRVRDGWKKEGKKSRLVMMVMVERLGTASVSVVIFIRISPLRTVVLLMDYRRDRSMFLSTYLDIRELMVKVGC